VFCLELKQNVMWKMQLVNHHVIQSPELRTLYSHKKSAKFFQILTIVYIL